MRKILFFLLIYNAMFSQVFSIPTAERSALISIYNQTDGKNWNRTWDITRDPKFWFGVVIKNGSVSEINLNGNGLKGNFPAVVSAFQSLKKLDLSANNLSGTISGISPLNLTKLDISENNLSGDPSAEIATQNQLTQLGVGNNSFTFSDINGFLSGFQNLEYLDIAKTGIASIPNSITTFTGLKRLSLSNNAIADFSGLSSMTGLQELNISGNDLAKIPTVISSLQNLKTLNLANNKLTSIAEISGNSSLEWLSLERNLFTGVPNEIAQLINLVHINLGRNQISSGFSPLLSLPNLEQLWLNNNLLKDGFPQDLLTIKKLLMLSLSSNQLTGSLPTNLPQIINISNNKFALNDIENYLALNNKDTEIIYSPQRYDDELTLKVDLGSSVLLPQSLNGSDGYTFSWYKGLDENLYSSLDKHNITNIKESDFTKYTAEAYIVKPSTPYLLEMSFFREPITLALDSSLSSQNITLKNLAIYPNPTSDYINIQAANHKVEQISIYDGSGKILLKDNKLRIDVSPFPSAMYIMTIKTDSGFHSFKFIKK